MTHLISQWSGPHFALSGLLAFGVGFFFLRVLLPKAINAFGFSHFDFKEAWRCPTLVTLGGAGLLTTASLTIEHFSKLPVLPGLTSLLLANLAVICVIDLKWQFIPDRFQWVGFFWAMTFVLWQVQSLPDFVWWEHVGSGLIGPFLLYLAGKAYEKTRKKAAMGLGDIKMLAWLGLGLGPVMAEILVLSLVFGWFIAILSAVLAKGVRPQTFAFAPSIALAVGFILVGA
jgi:Flp pilus assembly protein protease CpaA